MTEDTHPQSSAIPLYVLIADDNTEQHQEIGQFITDEGWTYDSVADTPSLLDALSSKSYDVVVTNLAMPDMQGTPLLLKIKEKRPSQAIIVVADTSVPKDLGKAIRSEQILDYFERPIDFGLLRNVLERLVHALHRSSDVFSVSNVVESVDREYKYCSAEFAENKPKFDIINELQHAGIIDLHTALRIELALQEAVANALEHGNLELESQWREEIDAEGRDKYTRLREERLKDPHYANRQIRIRVCFNEELLQFTIRDQGNGFLYEDDQTHDDDGGVSDDSLKCHGRGLTIMNGVMDTVRYLEHGRVVVLEKRMN